MTPRASTRIILVMGVSGSGKSTLGAALAERLGWGAFVDADDYHLPANRDKLTRGEPLTDADRQPWFERLRGVLEQHVLEGRGLVLACSALKEAYWDVLVAGLEGVRVVFLCGSRDLIAERMRKRTHFMPVSLLESQLLTLEPPLDAVVLDIAEPLEVLIDQVLAALMAET